MENLFPLLWLVVSLNAPLYVYAAVRAIKAGARIKIKVWIGNARDLLGDLFIFFPYMRKLARFAFLLFLLGSALALWSQVQSNAALAGFVDEGLVRRDWQLALLNLVQLAAFQIVASGLGMLTSWLSLWAVHTASEQQRLAYVDEQKTFKTRAVSLTDHESRKVTDPEELKDSYLEMLNAFQAIVSLLEIIATVIVLSKSLLGICIVLPALLCLIMLQPLLSKRYKALAQNRSITSMLDRALRRLALIALDALMRSGYTAPFMEKLKRDFKAYRKNVLYANTVGNLLAGVLTFSQRVIAPASLLIIVVLNQATLGTIIALMAQVERISDPLQEVLKGLLAYQQFKVNKGRLDKVTREAKRLQMVPHPLPAPKGKLLRLERVSFSTTDASGVERQLLSDITMDLVPGNVYYACGVHGTGKKTFFGSVIPGYRDYTGTITLDGLPVREYEPQTLTISHGEAAYPYLNGDGSIEDLLKFGMPDATDEQIEKNLGFAFWLQCVRHLPKGAQTLLVDLGKFSKADKRMLDFARVRGQLLYMKAAVAILLDPFRDVPPGQRPFILHIIEEMRRKQKIVLIASDKVVKPLPHWTVCFFPIGGGVKMGTFAELMKDPEFSTWWRQQSPEDWSTYDNSVKDALQKQFTKGENNQQLPAIAYLPWHGELKTTAKLALTTPLSLQAAPVAANLSQQTQTPGATRVLLPHEIAPKGQVQVTGILQSLPPAPMPKPARVLLPHER